MIVDDQNSKTPKNADKETNQPEQNHWERSFSNPVYINELSDGDRSPPQSPREWDTPASPHQQKSQSPPRAGDREPHPIILNVNNAYKSGTKLQSNNVSLASSPCYEVPVSSLQQHSRSNKLPSQSRMSPCDETPHQNNSQLSLQANVQAHQTSPHVNSKESELLHNEKNCGSRIKLMDQSSQLLPTDSHQYAILEAPQEHKQKRVMLVPLSMPAVSPCYEVPVPQQVQKGQRPVTFADDKPHPFSLSLNTLHSLHTRPISFPAPSPGYEAPPPPEETTGKTHPLSLSFKKRSQSSELLAPSPGYKAPSPPHLEKPHPLSLSFKKMSRSSELLAPSPGYKAPPPPQLEKPHPLSLSLKQRFKSGDELVASPCYEAPHPPMHTGARAHPLTLSLNLATSRDRSKSSDMLAPSPGYTAPPPPTNSHKCPSAKDNVVSAVSPFYDAPILQRMLSAPAASSPCYAVLEPPPQLTTQDVMETGDQHPMPTASPCYDQVFDEAPTLQPLSETKPHPLSLSHHAAASQDTKTSSPCYAVLEPPEEQEKQLDVQLEQTAAPVESPWEPPEEQGEQLDVKLEQTAAPVKLPCNNLVQDGHSTQESMSDTTGSETLN